MRAADALDYYGLGPSHEYRWTPVKFAKGLRELASELAGEPEAKEQALHEAATEAAEALESYIETAETVSRHDHRDRRLATKGEIKT